MPNLPIESEDDITKALNEIIRNPTNAGNQAILFEISGALTSLGSVDEETKELYDRAQAAVEAALAATRGPDWGTETAPPTQEFPDIRF